jgi:pimeloyl-ACP methyl ester carboxylesterase
MLAGTAALVGILGVVALFRGPWQDHPADPEALRTSKDLAGSFRQEEVQFHSGGNTLAGILVLPATPGPHPAVVFLTGSGATDRSNRGLFPPLWAHFARHGFASLAWDRPGVGRSTGNFEAQTFRDRAEEALAAVRLLRGWADIRRDAVGLWGFSQGAAVAPLAAALSRDLAFIVAVSGSQVPAWQQDPYRVEAELRADGFSEADVAEATAFAWKRMDLIRRARPFEELKWAHPSDVAVPLMSRRPASASPASAGAPAAPRRLAMPASVAALGAKGLSG